MSGEREKNGKDGITEVVDDVFEALSDVITGASKTPIEVTHWGVEDVGNGEYRVILDVRKK